MNDIKNILDRIRSDAIKKVQQSRRVNRKATKVVLQAKVAPSEFLQMEQLEKRINESITTRNIAAQEITAVLSDLTNDALLAFKGQVTQEMILESYPKNQFGPQLIFPENCKFFHWLENAKHGVAVIEQPPQVRTIRIYNETKHLPMPYVVFVVYFRQYRRLFRWAGQNVGFSTEPIRSMKDIIHYPPLPNFSGFNVCMGNFECSDGNVSTVVDKGIAEFWQSAFGPNMSKFKLGRYVIKNFDDWQHIKPLEILQATFDGNSSVEDFVMTFLNDQALDGDHPMNILIHETYKKFFDGLNINGVNRLLQKTARQILLDAIRKMNLQTPEK